MDPERTCGGYSEQTPTGTSHVATPSSRVGPTVRGAETAALAMPVNDVMDYMAERVDPVLAAPHLFRPHLSSCGGPRGAVGLPFPYYAPTVHPHTSAIPPMMKQRVPLTSFEGYHRIVSAPSPYNSLARPSPALVYALLNPSHPQRGSRSRRRESGSPSSSYAVSPLILAQPSRSPLVGGGSARTAGGDPPPFRLGQGAGSLKEGGGNCGRAAGAVDGAPTTTTEEGLSSSFLSPSRRSMSQHNLTRALSNHTLPVGSTAPRKSSVGADGGNSLLLAGGGSPSSLPRYPSNRSLVLSRNSSARCGANSGAAKGLSSSFRRINSKVSFASCASSSSPPAPTPHATPLDRTATNNALHQYISTYFAMQKCRVRVRGLDEMEGAEGLPSDGDGDDPPRGFSIVVDAVETVCGDGDDATDGSSSSSDSDDEGSSQPTSSSAPDRQRGTQVFRDRNVRSRVGDEHTNSNHHAVERRARRPAVGVGTVIDSIDLIRKFLRLGLGHRGEIAGVEGTRRVPLYDGDGTAAGNTEEGRQKRSDKLRALQNPPITILIDGKSVGVGGGNDGIAEEEQKGKGSALVQKVPPNVHCSSFSSSSSASPPSTATLAAVQQSLLPSYRRVQPHVPYPIHYSVVPHRRHDLGLLMGIYRYRRAARVLKYALLVHALRVRREVSASMALWEAVEEQSGGGNYVALIHSTNRERRRSSVGGGGVLASSSSSVSPVTQRRQSSIVAKSGDAAKEATPSPRRRSSVSASNASSFSSPMAPSPVGRRASGFSKQPSPNAGAGINSSPSTAPRTNPTGNSSNGGSSGVSFHPQMAFKAFGDYCGGEGEMGGGFATSGGASPPQSQKQQQSPLPRRKSVAFVDAKSNADSNTNHQDTNLTPSSALEGSGGALPPPPLSSNATDLSPADTFTLTAVKRATVWRARRNAVKAYRLAYREWRQTSDAALLKAIARCDDLHAGPLCVYLAARGAYGYTDPPQLGPSFLLGAAVIGGVPSVGAVPSYALLRRIHEVLEGALGNARGSHGGGGDDDASILNALLNGHTTTASPSSSSVAPPPLLTPSSSAVFNAKQWALRAINSDPSAMGLVHTLRALLASDKDGIMADAITSNRRREAAALERAKAEEERRRKREEARRKARHAAEGQKQSGGGGRSRRNSVTGGGGPSPARSGSVSNATPLSSHASPPSARRGSLMPTMNRGGGGGGVGVGSGGANEEEEDGPKSPLFSSSINAVDQQQLFESSQMSGSYSPLNAPAMRARSPILPKRRGIGGNSPSLLAKVPSPFAEGDDLNETTTTTTVRSGGGGIVTGGGGGILMASGMNTHPFTAGAGAALAMAGGGGRRGTRRVSLAFVDLPPLPASSDGHRRSRSNSPPQSDGGTSPSGSSSSPASSRPSSNQHRSLVSGGLGRSGGGPAGLRIIRRGVSEQQQQQQHARRRGSRSGSAAAAAVATRGNSDEGPCLSSSRSPSAFGQQQQHEQHGVGGGVRTRRQSQFADGLSPIDRYVRNRQQSILMNDAAMRARSVTAETTAAATGLVGDSGDGSPTAPLLPSFGGNAINTTSSSNQGSPLRLPFQYGSATLPALSTASRAKSEAASLLASTVGLRSPPAMSMLDGGGDEEQQPNADSTTPPRAGQQAKGGMRVGGVGGGGCQSSPLFNLTIDSRMEESPHAAHNDHHLVPPRHVHSGAAGTAAERRQPGGDGTEGANNSPLLTVGGGDPSPSPHMCSPPSRGAIVGGRWGGGDGGGAGGPVAGMGSMELGDLVITEIRGGGGGGAYGTASSACMPSPSSVADSSASPPPPLMSLGLFVGASDGGNSPLQDNHHSRRQQQRHYQHRVNGRSASVAFASSMAGAAGGGTHQCMTTSMLIATQNTLHDHSIRGAKAMVAMPLGSEAEVGDRTIDHASVANRAMNGAPEGDNGEGGDLGRSAAGALIARRQSALMEAPLRAEEQHALADPHPYPFRPLHPSGTTKAYMLYLEGKGPLPTPDNGYGAGRTKGVEEEGKRSSPQTARAAVPSCAPSLAPSSPSQPRPPPVVGAVSARTYAAFRVKEGGPFPSSASSSASATRRSVPTALPLIEGRGRLLAELHNSLFHHANRSSPSPSPPHHRQREGSRSQPPVGSSLSPPKPTLRPSALSPSPPSACRRWGSSAGGGTPVARGGGGNINTCSTTAASVELSDYTRGARLAISPRHHPHAGPIRGPPLHPYDRRYPPASAATSSAAGDGGVAGDCDGLIRSVANGRGLGMTAVPVGATIDALRGTWAYASKV